MRADGSRQSAYCLAVGEKETHVGQSWKKENSSQILLFQLANYVYIQLYTQSQNTLTIATIHKKKKTQTVLAPAKVRAAVAEAKERD